MPDPKPESKLTTAQAVPEDAPKDDSEPARRDLRPGEILCGVCGYPVKVEVTQDEQGNRVEKLLPHFGVH
jgi:hypothetical protein